MEVPTLLPMLRMKLTMPATALLFSAGMPMYAASVIGTKKETDTDNLGDAQPRSGNEADRQVNPLGGVIHRDC